MQQQKNEQVSNQITITVSDPEVRKEYGGARQYYLYALKGQDAKGPIAILRRYSDFDSLRNLLVKRWPGCYIPSLPSKVKLTHSDEQFLETRSKYLQKFLLEVSRKHFLWESDEMQIFLRNDMMDFDKVLTPLWKIDPAQLLYRFGTHFKDVAVEGAMERRIENFSQYLGGLFAKVQELRNRAQQINSAQAKYQKKYSKFLLNVLAAYEEKFLHYYNRDNPAFQPIFSAPENEEKKNDLEQSLKQAPLRVLFEQLKREKREIFAMQQAIREYDDYVKEKGRLQGKIKEHETKISQLKVGRKSFLSKIRSLSADDEIKTHEKAIEKYKADLQTQTELCELMTRVLLVQEIESFKTERTTSYYHMVRQIAQEELQIIEKERDFWLAVCNNNNFNFDIQDSPQKPPPPRKILSEITLPQEDKKQKPQQGSEEQVQESKVEIREEKSKQTEAVLVRPAKEAEMTEKTKSVADSPQREQSPPEHVFVPEDDDFQQITSDKEEQRKDMEKEDIQSPHIHIEVEESPHEPSDQPSRTTKDTSSPQKHNHDEPGSSNDG